jgi:hypothetical protein
VSGHLEQRQKVMERPTNISLEKVNVWEHFSGLDKDMRKNRNRLQSNG